MTAPMKRRCGRSLLHAAHDWMDGVGLAHRCDGGSNYVDAFVTDDAGDQDVQAERGMYHSLDDFLPLYVESKPS